MTAIGLYLGDRYGVGPELVASLLSRLDQTGDRPPLLVIGDSAVLENGARSAGMTLDITTTQLPVVPEGLDWAMLDQPTDAPVTPLGTVTQAAGEETLRALSRLSGLAVRGEIAGIVYAPLNKSALRLAGHAAGDELDYFVDQMKPTTVAQEINILDELWTSRVTSHIPIRQVADRLTIDSVGEAIELVSDSLTRAGRTRPRIAVAALNPHAGDDGAFGREEIDVIGPALEQAEAKGLDVIGPLPADTIFPQALREGYDGIVTMFHDQGQIALKALGLGRGITLLAGLPVPVATPSHGTAYDIAGQGIAKVDALAAALDLVANMISDKKE